MIGCMSPDESASVPATERFSVVETDHFCDCGYNLHNQRTERDARLGFAIVRCPECGKFHPANHASTANRVWLKRLAAVLLLVWVLTLLFFYVALGFAAFGTVAGYIDLHTQWAMTDPETGRLLLQENEWDSDAQQSIWTYRYADTNEIVPPPSAGSGVSEFPNGRRDYPTERQAVWNLPDGYDGPYGWNRTNTSWHVTAHFVGWSALAGLIVGTLQAAVLWHLGWSRKLLPPIALGLLTSAFVLMLGYYGGYDHAMEVAFWGIVVVIGSLLVGWIIGLVVGRPIARFLVQILVPPKPRQTLAHLWHADGKTLAA
jgi:hypothetical protein